MADKKRRRRPQLMTAAALRAATTHSLNSTPVVAQFGDELRMVVDYRVEGQPRAEPPSPQVLVLVLGGAVEQQEVSP